MDDRKLKKTARIRGSGVRNIQPSELNINNNNKPQHTNQRINKQSARVRGSGLRNTKNAQSLTIDSKSPNENKRLVQQLSSALVHHQEDLQLTRSTRRKSSILPYTIIDKLPPARRKKSSKRVSFKEPTTRYSPQDNNTEPELPEIESPQEENSLDLISKKSVGRPKKQKSLRGRKPKPKEQEQEQDQAGKENEALLLKAKEIDDKIAKVKQRIKESGLIGNKKLNNHSHHESSLLDSPRSENSEIGLISGSSKRPMKKKKKSTNGESSLISQPSSPPPLPPQAQLDSQQQQRQVIPTPTPSPEASDSEFDSEEDESHDPDYGRSSKIAPIRNRHGGILSSSLSTRNRRQALPLLSKSKNKISIDYPTLINASNTRGRIQRARMLDVLRSLISTFEPPPSIPTKNLPIHEIFKNNLLANIDKLRDETTTIEDIAKNVYSVQRAKKEIRQMILDLKNDHTDIGNQLNQLRVDVKNKKQEVEDLNLLADQLKETKDYINGTNDLPEGLNNKVQLKLFTIGKILNPQTGLHAKLGHINEKLEQLDNDL